MVVSASVSGGRASAIIIAKQRNGRTAKIRLAFLEHLTRFSDV